jgi:hypothetical protein
MKRYSFSTDAVPAYEYCEQPDGEWTRFEDHQADVERRQRIWQDLLNAERTKWQQLMDQYMELKGYLAEAESACDAWEIKNGDAPHRCVKLADRIRVSGGLLPAPSEAKGGTPDE